MIVKELRLIIVSTAMAGMLFISMMDHIVGGNYRLALLSLGLFIGCVISAVIGWRKVRATLSALDDCAVYNDTATANLLREYATALESS